MSLSRAAQHHVDRGVRQRGAGYHIARRVRIIAGTQRRVVATVSGSRQVGYQVELKVSDDRPQCLVSRCSCPYFSGTGICKHIWATLLEAEERRLLGDAAAQHRVELLDADLEHGRPVSWEDELQDEFEDELEAAPARDEGHNEPHDASSEVHSSRYPDHSNEVLAERGSSRRRQATWERELERVRHSALAAQQDRAAAAGRALPAASQLIYVLDTEMCRITQAFALQTFTRRPKRQGGWTEPRGYKIDESKLSAVPTVEDQRILTLLTGAATGLYGRYYGGYYGGRSEPVNVRPQAQDTLVPLLCATGRLFSRDQHSSDLTPLGLDDGEPWELQLRVLPDETGEGWWLDGVLCRGEQTESLARPALLLRSGWLVMEQQLARLSNPECFGWVSSLRLAERLEVPRLAEDEFLQRMHDMAPLPPVHWPEPLQLRRVREPLQPGLHIARVPSEAWAGPRQLDVMVSFSYGGKAVSSEANGPKAVFVPEGRVLIERDTEAEAAALALVVELGGRPASASAGGRGPQPAQFMLAPSKLAPVVRRLVAEGWRVEAEGRRYRAAGITQLRVRSGVDWFDLEGEVQYGSEAVPLPAVLQALRRGDAQVVLDDGSIGLLPEKWLEGMGLLQAAGTLHDDAIRFRSSQASLLDALLSEQQEQVDASWDKTFARARTELRRFDRVRACSPARSFRGTLREYQREGLGWAEFLRRFGMGGCLADDMGLGKTVQALALLDRRRAQAQRQKRPAPISLVVAPKSVVENWQAETERFAPRLRVLVHGGPGRAKDPAALAGHDLVLTTYGVLRKDAMLLSQIPFDYAILDEAQAIKNAQSQSAKAARLLQADHRLALSGTPVENHLGELWSLFEFLNPGMLGSHTLFSAAARRKNSAADTETLRLIGQALRPLILRRTKEQVAADLPPKTEQTIYCDLEAGQLRLYRQVRDHYRGSLLGDLDDAQLKRSKIQVLEALLRLRQIACHAALVDRSHDGKAASSKLDLLDQNLEEVLSEGHKALVFSQFTSLLAFVRERLDRKGIVYEYLDGRTRKRADKVARFQQDDSCKVFLISLKAGGLGLNLTAADYVFLLDPWWNPAVEAQAVDRAHRIGQERPVFAYRLIARDTVEEKVLELQQHKRQLADAILGGQANLLRDLTRKDLETLLS